MVTSTFFQRVTAYAALGGSRSRSPTATVSMPGSERMYVGERCSMVTRAAAPSPRAIAGTRVTAVAPLPITTTRLPA